MYAMNFAQVGANIQNELNEKSMSQQNLADALSISKQVMSKIINGAKAINVNELVKIAEVLGTTADKLLSVKPQNSNDESLAFMGMMQDNETRKKVELIRMAIDEIQFLEEIVDVK